MNLLLLNIWNFLKQKNRWLIALVIIIILSQMIMIHFKNLRIAKLKDQVETEIKLNDALHDTVSYYKNLHSEWVAEKLTIQETIKNLEKINGQLTESQKELLVRVKEIEKKNSIIAAALIETHVKLDSLLHNGKTTVDTLNKKVSFSDYYKKDGREMGYSLVIGNVVPFKFGTKPTLLIDSLYFPNKQFVEFHWKDEKKKNYPISFSVSNSNGFFKTVDINSYAIPAIQKDNLNPTGWQKFGQWMIKNGKTIGFVSVGIAGGVAGTWLMNK